MPLSLHLNASHATVSLLYSHHPSFCVEPNITVLLKDGDTVSATWAAPPFSSQAGFVCTFICMCTCVCVCFCRFLVGVMTTIWVRPQALRV